MVKRTTRHFVIPLFGICVHLECVKKKLAFECGCASCLKSKGFELVTVKNPETDVEQSRVVTTAMAKLLPEECRFLPGEGSRP